MTSDGATGPRPVEDPDLILDVMAYVDEIHRELAAENTAPPPGVQNQVVEAVLADPALARVARDWAERNRVLEASLDPPRRPGNDPVYRHVRDLLRKAERKATMVAGHSSF
jgi:hypothetical protein